MGANKELSELLALDLRAKQRLYPNLPSYAITKPKYTDKTANGLTKMIIDYIRLNGGQAERINCTGRIIDNRKSYIDVLGHTRTIGSIEYVKTNGTRGTSDISATIKGFSVKIEVKIGRDRQSPAQLEYQKAVEAAGGVYFIAKDFQSFYKWYNYKF